MKHTFSIAGLTLSITVLFASSQSVRASHSANHIVHSKLAARDQAGTVATANSPPNTVSPCSGSQCIGAQLQEDSLACDYTNGTTLVAGNSNETWTILCNIDFYAQNIYPFILAGSFNECLDFCDQHNQQAHTEQCAGFVFAPGRVHNENDCYLKSSVENATYPSTIHLIGATLVPQASSTAVTMGPISTAMPADSDPAPKYQMATPSVADSKFLGTTTNQPTKQYVSHLPALPNKIASNLLKPGINIDLVTKYALATDTGSWTESSLPFQYDMANLSITPRLSRDGGKGGNINGTHIFYFCDTSTFGDDLGPLGYMNGFVSSSASVDVSDGVSDGALVISDPIGQWQDDVGRLRGWVPLTTGEEAFNIAISGDGYRYAVWPESSFIPLNQTHSVIYAPVVYVEVDMQTQRADFTSLGNTLIMVSVDPTFGPHADRIVNQLFTQAEVEWGSLGGLRAWTSTGFGSNDGMIYLFGQVEAGVLVAKVLPDAIADRSSYSYWNGTAWDTTMQTQNSTAYLIQQPVMDFDLFYSPYHKSFFMVYLTPYADNTFYFRFLQSDHDIYPPFMSNGTEDYAESILHQDWSEPVVLWKADVPASGYIYAGGCHLGYYGSGDISNGGQYLLITWTEHTPKDPNDPSSGYAHKSAKITLAWKADDLDSS